MGHSNKGHSAINKHIDVVLTAAIGSPFLVDRRKDNNRKRRQLPRGYFMLSLCSSFFCPNAGNIEEYCQQFKNNSILLHF